MTTTRWRRGMPGCLFAAVLLLGTAQANSIFDHVLERVTQDPNPACDTYVAQLNDRTAALDSCSKNVNDTLNAEFATEVRTLVKRYTNFDIPAPMAIKDYRPCSPQLDALMGVARAMFSDAKCTALVTSLISSQFHVDAPGMGRLYGNLSALASVADCVLRFNTTAELSRCSLDIAPAASSAYYAALAVFAGEFSIATLTNLKSVLESVLAYGVCQLQRTPYTFKFADPRDYGVLMDYVFYAKDRLADHYFPALRPLNLTTVMVDNWLSLLPNLAQCHGESRAAAADVDRALGEDRFWNDELRAFLRRFNHFHEMPLKNFTAWYDGNLRFKPVVASLVSASGCMGQWDSTDGFHHCLYFQLEAALEHFAAAVTGRKYVGPTDDGTPAGLYVAYTLPAIAACAGAVGGFLWYRRRRSKRSGYQPINA